uniref:Cleft lip and palate associated transmembrane protein 1 n=1 Tax=Loa loa TaxID=7209 RepID=A0A1I7V7D3_LOALO
MSGNNEISNDGGGGGVVETGDQVQANPEQQRGFDTWTFVKGMLYRIMIVYFVTSFLKNFMSGRSGNIGYNNTGVSNRGASLPSRNLFQPGQKFDLYIYLSDSQDRFDEFDDESALFWKETGLTYSDWTSGPDGDGSRTKSATFPTPKSLANNGSLYIHVFIVRRINHLIVKVGIMLKERCCIMYDNLTNTRRSITKNTKSAYWQNRADRGRTKEG